LEEYIVAPDSKRVDVIARSFIDLDC